MEIYEDTSALNRMGDREMQSYLQTLTKNQLYKMHLRFDAGSYIGIRVGKEAVRRYFGGRHAT